ncbi:MAG: uridine kinase [Candidatus Pelagibacter sp.]|nr:uridine kinase [Candidatus Pelagibacter sp.]|tara:strand:+ start:141 stop:1058 length:918 start_codon:yes stop_codon:yes gene_type:complete
MILDSLKTQKIKKKYFNFLKSQEVKGEPFLDKSKQLQKFYLPICKYIFHQYKKDKKSNLIGLSGAQGSGKSTIAKILKILLEEKYKLKVINFSIDDYYKTIKSRKKLSKNTSKLFLTRGVPGTHDTKLLQYHIKNLKSKNFKNFYIPKFDKSIDNRLPKKKWSLIKEKPDIIIFEGWCVGATPFKNSDIKAPINLLEKKEDKKMIWRKTVNKELKNNYKKIFDMIDRLIFLKIPSFKYVFKWRLLQESKLKAKSSRNKIMGEKQIREFIMFYERITKKMISQTQKYADVVIKLDAKHKLKSIKIK